jgi:hypothetical protein
MENGKWKMENGKWKMENGKWRTAPREAYDAAHGLAYICTHYIQNASVPSASSAREDKLKIENEKLKM